MVQVEGGKQWSDVAYIVAFILGPVIASYFNSRSAKKAAEKVKEETQVAAREVKFDLQKKSDAVRQDLHERSDRQDDALQSIQTIVNGRYEAEQRKNADLTALVASLRHQLETAGIEPDMSATHKRRTDT